MDSTWGAATRSWHFPGRNPAMGSSPMAWVRYMNPPHSAMQGSPPSSASRTTARMDSFRDSSFA